MRVISPRRLREFVATHHRAAGPLKAWLDVVTGARWRNIGDLRRDFPSADGGVPVASGRSVTVFNIAGNKYRLVADLHYNRDRVYILRVMTHAEYDSGQWKRQL